MYIRGIRIWFFFFFFFLLGHQGQSKHVKWTAPFFFLLSQLSMGLRSHWLPLSWRKAWVDWTDWGMGVCWLESAQAPPWVSMLSVHPRAQPTETQMGQVWAGEWLEEPPRRSVQLGGNIGCEATWSSTCLCPGSLWVLPGLGPLPE